MTPINFKRKTEAGSGKMEVKSSFLPASDFRLPVSRSQLSTLLLTCMTVILCACSSRQPEEAAVRPNVVLILTDDQGFGDLSLHGNPWVETPAIDSLARAGTRLDRFFVCPLCAPTRASLLTGRYHLRTGVTSVTNGLENMRAEEVTLAELFRSAGYATGCFGKWHNGAYWPYHPNAQGFDEFIGFCAGHWNNYFNTTLEHNGKPFPTQGYITDVLTDQALSFIENNRQQPFFCYIPYNVPHSPFQVPDAYFDKYYKKLSGITDEAERRKNAAVYGMCENVDDNVRRVTQKLEAWGLSDNTIVIYLSDNGPNGSRYNDNMRGTKGTVHEGGVRVPFFIRWPQHIPAGNTLPQIAAHIDLLPTLASLCDISLPDSLSLDGVDLKALLTGSEQQLAPRTIFFQQSGKTLEPVKGGLRNERYRLALQEEDQGLFDMIADPSETHDLSAAMPERYDSLRQVYAAWYQSATAGYQPNTRIPVGYQDFPYVRMPAHESQFSGSVAFKEGHGWANDWLVGWSSPADTIWWDIEVKEAGKYHLSLLYTCPASDVGSTVTATAGSHRATAQVTRAYDPAYLPSPDRVTRQEVYEKEWATLHLGTIVLEPGKHRLLLQASNIPGKQVMELKSVTLERM